MKIGSILFGTTLAIVIGSILWSQKTPKVTTNAPAANTSQCVITIDGQKYDVTSFRNIHRGGDVFNCGTDMSTIFHDRHNQRYLEMMQPYKI